MKHDIHEDQTIEEGDCSILGYSLWRIEHCNHSKYPEKGDGSGVGYGDCDVYGRNWNGRLLDHTQPYAVYDGCGCHSGCGSTRGYGAG